MASEKKISDYVPPLKEQKIDYLVGSPQGNKSILSATVVSAGTTLVVDFLATFGVVMKDASYQIVASSDANSSMSYSAKTASGFTLANVQASEVIDIVVIGKVAGQP